MKRYDVAIIGVGIVGASALYALTRAGLRAVLAGAEGLDVVGEAASAAGVRDAVGRAALSFERVVEAGPARNG